MYEKKIDVSIKLTPRELAELFCEMNNEEMAEFFTECKRLSEGPDWSAGGIYVMGLWMRDEMKPGTPGADFLMDLAAPWYTHTLMYVDNHGERERA